MSLPVIEVLATGGTIAGAGNDEVASAYCSGTLGVNELVAAVPQLAQRAQLVCKQVVNIGSQDMTEDVWLKLVQTINEDADKVDGFVITHGTDTMEETAYFVHLAAKTDKPIIFVGSMRPATGLSADGPKNLYNAVVAAASEKTRGMGALICMNDLLVSARDAIKHDTTSVQTFSGANFGTVGFIHNSQVTIGMRSTFEHTTQTPFDVTGLTQLPKVGIVYNYAHVPAEPLLALLQAGFVGIVNAGLGNGNIHKHLLPHLAQAVQDGVTVVRSSRAASGSSTQNGETDDARYGFIASEFLNPQKARVLLQLALTVTDNKERIQAFFERY